MIRQRVAVSGTGTFLPPLVPVISSTVSPPSTFLGRRRSEPPLWSAAADLGRREKGGGEEQQQRMSGRQKHGQQRRQDRVPRAPLSFDCSFNTTTRHSLAEEPRRNQNGGRVWTAGPHLRCCPSGHASNGGAACFPLMMRLASPATTNRLSRSRGASLATFSTHPFAGATDALRSPTSSRSPSSSGRRFLSTPPSSAPSPASRGTPPFPSHAPPGPPKRANEAPPSTPSRPTGTPPLPPSRNKAAANIVDAVAVPKTITATPPTTSSSSSTSTTSTATPPSMHSRSDKPPMPDFSIPGGRSATAAAWLDETRALLHQIVGLPALPPSMAQPLHAVVERLDTLPFQVLVVSERNLSRGTLVNLLLDYPDGKQVLPEGWGTESHDVLHISKGDVFSERPGPPGHRLIRCPAPTLQDVEWTVAPSLGDVRDPTLFPSLVARHADLLLFVTDTVRQLATVRERRFARTYRDANMVVVLNGADALVRPSEDLPTVVAAVQREVNAPPAGGVVRSGGTPTPSSSAAAEKEEGSTIPVFPVSTRRAALAQYLQGIADLRRELEESGIPRLRAYVEGRALETERSRGRARAALHYGRTALRQLATAYETSQMLLQHQLRSSFRADVAVRVAVRVQTEAWAAFQTEDGPGCRTVMDTVQRRLHHLLQQPLPSRLQGQQQALGSTTSLTDRKGWWARWRDFSAAATKKTTGATGGRDQENRWRGWVPMLRGDGVVSPVVSAGGLGLEQALAEIETRMAFATGRLSAILHHGYEDALASVRDLQLRSRAAADAAADVHPWALDAPPAATEGDDRPFGVAEEASFTSEESTAGIPEGFVSGGVKVPFRPSAFPLWSGASTPSSSTASLSASSSTSSPLGLSSPLPIRPMLDPMMASLDRLQRVLERDRDCYRRVNPFALSNIVWRHYQRQCLLPGQSSRPFFPPPPTSPSTEIPASTSQAVPPSMIGGPIAKPLRGTETPSPSTTTPTSMSKAPSSSSSALKPAPLTPPRVTAVSIASLPAQLKDMATTLVWKGVLWQGMGLAATAWAWRHGIVNSTMLFPMEGAFAIGGLGWVATQWRTATTEAVRKFAAFREQLWDDLTAQHARIVEDHFTTPMASALDLFEEALEEHSALIVTRHAQVMRLLAKVDEALAEVQ